MAKVSLQLLVVLHPPLPQLKIGLRKLYPLESALYFVLGKYPALAKVISLPSFRYPTVFLGSLLVSCGEVTETAI